MSNAQRIIDRLPEQARRDLQKLPERERKQVVAALAAHPDGKGRRGELFTPTGAGRHR